MVGCAELATLSADVVEIRSLVVAEHARGLSVGRRIIDHLVDEAIAESRTRLCAFTHQPGYFVRLGFSIVPHLWLREKVFTDCVGCPLFRTCGQHAMMLKLDERRDLAASTRRGRVTVTPIEGGITAPAGFRAAGVSAGIKASGAPDLALIVADRPVPRPRCSRRTRCRQRRSRCRAST